MGPYTTQERRAQLAYHVTVNRKGVITKLQPDFDYPKRDLGKPWREGLVDFINIHGGIKHIIDRFDFDRLIIHVAGNSEPKEQKTMKLTARQNSILTVLRENTSANSVYLASTTGIPVATVRRNIASLRNKGYDIENVAWGGYMLNGQLPVTSPAQAPQSEADDLRDEYSAPEYYEGDPGDENDYDPFDPFDDGGDL